MSTLTIELDDADALLVQAAARAMNQPVREWVRASIQLAAARAAEPAAPAPRVSPLHPGAIQPAPDFNAPLPEFAPYI